MLLAQFFVTGGLLVLGVAAGPANQLFERQACNRDNCFRAVIASAFPGGSTRGSADCSSFMKRTVTPCVVSTTTTLISTVMAAAVTQTLSLTSSTVIQHTATQTSSTQVTSTLSSDTTISTLSTATEMVTSTVTTTIISTTTVTPGFGPAKRAVESGLSVNAAMHITVVVPADSMAKRQAGGSSCPATGSPTAVPTYASACSGAARYSSACSCNGILSTATTLAPVTSTITVTSTSVVTPTSTVSSTNIIQIDSTTTASTTATMTVTSTIIVSSTSVYYTTTTLSSTTTTTTRTQTTQSVGPSVFSGAFVCKVGAPPGTYGIDLDTSTPGFPLTVGSSSQLVDSQNAQGQIFANNRLFWNVALTGFDDIVLGSPGSTTYDNTAPIPDANKLRCTRIAGDEINCYVPGRPIQRTFAMCAGSNRLKLVDGATDACPAVRVTCRNL